MDKQFQKQTRAGSHTGSLFKLYKAKKDINAVKPVKFICNMIEKKTAPPGKIARYYKHFKDKLKVDRHTIYVPLPAQFLLDYESPADRAAIVALIDAQDDNGFTALHWAVFRSSIRLIEALLENGANTEIETFVNRHKPIHKLVNVPYIAGRSTIPELFRKYKDINMNKNDLNQMTVTATPQKQTEIARDSSPLPFLELPIELQTIILEQLSIGTILTVRCVCKYFNTMHISNKHVTDLPETGIFKFVDPVEAVDRWRRRNEPQCSLTVMATPTVFHFALIMGELYKEPANKGDIIDIVNEMMDRMEKFAKEDEKFKYDIEKLKEFLLNCWSNDCRYYFFHCNKYTYARYMLFVELDTSIGFGIEFTAPGDVDPADDDW